MTELYIFDQDDHLLTIISEETGLLSTQFREELNHIPDTPFVFSVEADLPKAKYIVEENQVVFRDTEGDLRLFRIKEIDDQDNIDGPVTTATCEPACMELNDHIIVDRRFVNQTADVALNAALEGTRWTGTVEVELSTATTNFYYISSIEAIWNILQVWGGDFKDVVTFDEQNNITSRQIRIKQRLGADHGKRFEIDHNTTEIGRTVLSYPVTALYGRGASLPIEDDEGEHTGGYTRYIDFADVVWRKANGDPVDKPKGQRWVGDPNALQKYGYLDNGQRLHRYDVWQNQDIEDPAELLRATWEQLQTAQKPEVNYRLSVDLFDQKVSLGDTARAIDRQFARPIEIQARVVAVEYDLLDVEGTMVVEMGQLLNLDDDRLDRVIETINRNQGKWDSGGTITRGRFPDIKPSKPANLRAEGGFEAIQLYWDYADELYIDNYEVYGSQVKDFVPDSQHLLWRGKVSAFAHWVERDQVWYYRVRAVNYHGRPSDYSDQVSASTHRVISDDILFGPDLAERLRELNRISDIIGVEGVRFENISQHARDLLEQEARQYTDAEIRAVEEQINAELAEKAGLDYVNGKFSFIDNELDTINGKFVSINTQISELDGEINLKADKTQVDAIEGEITNVAYDLSQLTINVDGIQSQVVSIRSDLDNLEIGGRNLAKKSAVGKWADGWTENNYVYTLSTSSGRAGIHIDSGVFEEGEYYILSFKIRKLYGDITTIAGHRTAFGEDKVYRDGALVSTDWSSRSNPYPNDNEVHQYHVYLKCINLSVDDARLYIQPNRTAYGVSYEAEIWDLQVERGNKPTDWTPAPEDAEARISRAETLIDQNAQQIALRATKTEVNSLAGRMTQAESELVVLADEINLKVDVDGIVTALNLSQEGVRIKGSLIHLDGLTLIDSGIIQTAHIENAAITRAKLDTAVIGTAQIEDLAVTSAKISSVNADKINASTLSAISANMGTLRSGRLLSNNNNMDLNLNTGSLHMQNAHFTLGNGAKIDFLDNRNQITYTLNNRTAGFGVGTAMGGVAPYAYMGATPFNNGELDTLNSAFTGFIVNTTYRINEDGAANSITGNRFQFRNQAVGYDKGFTFDFFGSRPSVTPMSAGTYNYDFGAPAARFDNVYANRVRGNGQVYIRDAFGNGGYIITTNWSGDPVSGSTNLVFRGVNYGLGFRYNLGAENSPFSFGRINTIYYNNLNQNSLRAFKEDINDLDLCDALDYVRNTELKTYYYKDQDGERSKYDLKVGIIHDDIKLAKDYLVKSSETSVDQSNIIFMIQAVTKYNLSRVDKHTDEINWLKVENQLLRAEIKQLKEKIA